MLVAESDLSQFLNRDRCFFVCLFFVWSPPTTTTTTAKATVYCSQSNAFFQAGDVYRCVPNISYAHDIAQYEFSY